MSPSSSVLPSLLTVLLVTTGCSNSTNSDAGPDPFDPNPSMVRVENATLSDFVSTLVANPGESVEYGPIAAGAMSDFTLWNEAYSYAYVEVELANGDVFTIQPFDFVGEVPLGDGRFRYVLSFDDPLAPGQLLIALQNEN